MIVPPNQTIHVTEISNSRVGLPFLVDSKSNPNVLHVNFGGRYIGDKLSVLAYIGGSLCIDRNGSSEMADFAREYCKEITKKFKPIRHHIERETWRVGPEALEDLRQGARLITEEPSFPPEWDLRLPPPK